MGAPEEVKNLVKRFATNEADYSRPTYLEASVRQDFLDPFFSALGWDVGNAKGLAEHLREVKVETTVDVDGQKKAPDYEFRAGGIKKFFVEAKRPSIAIERDPGPALQVRRYGWNGGVAYSVLTDFQEFSLYDTRLKPEADDGARIARLDYFSYVQYVDEWEWFEQRFSRDAVYAGELDKIAADKKVSRRTVPVDAEILGEIERWRTALAFEIHRAHPELSAFEIGGAVQLLVDRILFLRICEDRGIEPSGRLLDLSQRSDAYKALVEAFTHADTRYNSGLFHLANERGRASERDELTPRLTISDTTIRSMIGSLYWPRSAFNFRMLDPQVLGNAYEQFLGRVITIAGKSVKIEEKPEVARAGGVVYTPQMVVAYILDKTLSVALTGMTIDKATGKNRAQGSHPLRLLDPSCGSGSFLMAAYQRLLDWFLEQYSRTPEKWLSGREPRIFEAQGGGYLLTTAERKRIVLDHIFGVDIDPQAVEVTKLSLLLKVLENESAESVDQQLKLLHERALPDLGNNIKCGNSLIDEQYYGLEPRLIDNEIRARKINPFNWRDEFPQVFKVPRPGFDVVIGNPPYVLLQDEFRDDLTLEYLRKHYLIPSFKIDLYHVFMERTAMLARADGYCSMITPSNWLTNNNLIALRRFMLDKVKLLEVSILDSNVFHGRAVDTAIYVAKFDGANKTNEFDLNKYVLDAGRSRLIQTSSTELSESDIRRSSHLLFTGGGTEETQAAMQQLVSATVPLKRLATVNFGKQLRNAKLFPDDIIQLPSLTSRVPATHRRCYTGSDATRWRATWSGLICLDDTVAQSGGTWNPDRQNAKNKLLCKQIGLFPEWGIDEPGYQVLNRAFMLSVTDAATTPWFLLGVLNSLPLQAFWLNTFWDRRRTFPKVKGTYLDQLPIPKKRDAAVDQIVKDLIKDTQELATQSVGSARHSQLTRNIAAAEARLNSRVADLFGLTAAHIQALQELVDEAKRVGST